MNELYERCKDKGDLIVISHRSTLQTVMRAVVGDEWEGETKLEYGGLSMFVEVEGDDGAGTGVGGRKWVVQTFNELAYLRDRIRSPSSNPFRHIEGYYEDLDWGSVKGTTAAMWDSQETSTTQ
eukprot:TRINITY_DN22804_c0_g1_i1.p1 TRINITY_DN22804_c0_g1~~TRINITY_DN22804_c0_g1_i1.p1  ORF type:complete len:123 (-),score=47.89 TRINITY_DN22804_c0_g1_i1:37-405(-)